MLFPEKLSVAMIVRNEEANIKKALDSAVKVADEIIVNDTGSTDKTKEIIASYNGVVRLISSKWCNDFAKSRNLALKFCSYGWIMWLDADDIIPDESIERIKELKNEPLDSFFFFNIVNTKQGEGIGHKFFQARMFPNSDSIFFEDPIHERVSPSAIRKGLKPVAYKGIKIFHTGYENKENLKKKSLRNIRLIKTIPDYKGSYTWLKHLGVAYQFIDPKKSYNYFLQASFINDTPEIFCKLGNSQLSDEPKKAIKYYKIGLEKDPDHVEMNYHLAKAYEGLGEWNLAIKGYEKVIDLPDKDSLETVPYDHARIYSFHYLLRIYTAFNMNRDAIQLIQKMNIFYPKYRCSDD